MNFLYVFLGGGLGSLARFLISYLFVRTNISLPFSTLLSNVVSCIIFAILLLNFSGKNLIPDTYKYFVLIGICGGLSTFSTFSFETFELFKQGMAMWAILNIILNCTICIALFYVVTK